MTARRLACVLLLVASSRVIVAQSPATAVAFQATRLGLDVSVDYTRAALSGTHTMVVRNVSGRRAGVVPLLLNRLMTASDVRTATGVPLAFSQRVVVFEDDSMKQVTAIEVRLPRAIAPGDSTTIRVRYAGRLVGYAETGSLYIRDRIDREFTILREDALAFPVVGVPSNAKNRSVPRIDFAFTASVTVPRGAVVAMGGRHAGTVPHDSVATWSYRSDRGVPFLNIAIAPYRQHQRRGARIFYFAQDSLGANMVDSAIAGAIDRFTAWFGPVGEELDLTVMEIPEGFGSQASLTAGIIETADAFRDRAQLYQLYHELSHLWNAPDRDARSPRWNEGLASFLQWRMAATLDGWVAWDARVQRLEANVRGQCAQRTICGTVPFAEYGAQGLTDLSYPVGALMFYALFRTLGADGFDRTYRDLFQARRAGVLSRDLIAAFSEADPRAAKIMQEWFTTTTWYDRLKAGESARAIIDSYVAPAG